MRVIKFQALLILLGVAFSFVQFSVSHSVAATLNNAANGEQASELFGKKKKKKKEKPKEIEEHDACERCTIEQVCMVQWYPNGWRKTVCVPKGDLGDHQYLPQTQ